jgi:membrane fusion protein (multidrug efflux system)
LKTLLSAASTLAAALLVFVASGCKKEQSGPPPAPPPPTVTVIPVTVSTVPIEFREIGQLAASKRVEIRARIKGYILKRHFEEGGTVKAGQLLYEIDPKEYQVALAQAQANLTRAEANLELAQRDVARLEPLVRSQSISRKELDDAENRLKVAQGDVAANRAEIERAELSLSYTQIHSPVDGIITLTRKEEGSFVDDLNNSLLTVALQTQPMYVNFAVPERSMLKYRSDISAGRLRIPVDNNWKVLIELLDGSVYERSGKLTIVGFEVDQSTGSALFRAEVPNPDGELLDGQFVRVRLQGAVRPDAISVPQRAVQMGDQGAFVFVVDKDNKAQMRPVETGGWSPPNWIINSGLNPGDRVIIEGLQFVVPNSPVTLATPSPSASVSPAPASAPAAR